MPSVIRNVECTAHVVYFVVLPYSNVNKNCLLSICHIQYSYIQYKIYTNIAAEANANDVPSLRNNSKQALYFCYSIDTNKLYLPTDNRVYFTSCFRTHHWTFTHIVQLPLRSMRCLKMMPKIDRMKALSHYFLRHLWMEWINAFHHLCRVNLALIVNRLCQLLLLTVLIVG